MTFQPRRDQHFEFDFTVKASGFGIEEKAFEETARAILIGLSRTIPDSEVIAPNGDILALGPKNFTIEHFPPAKFESDGPEGPEGPDAEAVQLATLFHDTYERLAPMYGYNTRKVSKGSFEDLPAPLADLMIATCKVILGSN